MPRTDIGIIFVLVMKIIGINAQITGCTMITFNQDFKAIIVKMPTEMTNIFKMATVKPDTKMSNTFLKTTVAMKTQTTE